MTLVAKTGIALLILVTIASLFLAVLFYMEPLKAEEPIFVTTTIPVAHEWHNGIHTYIGSVVAPSPCYEISGDAAVAESYPEQVRVTLEMVTTSGVCSQVVTEKKFKVSFHASDKAVVRAYLNGNPVLFLVTETQNDSN